MLPKNQCLCYVSSYLLDETHYLEVLTIFLDSYLILQTFYTDLAFSHLSHCVYVFSSWRSFAPLFHLANICFSSQHKFCLYSMTQEIMAADCRSTFVFPHCMLYLYSRRSGLPLCLREHIYCEHIGYFLFLESSMAITDFFFKKIHAQIKFLKNTLIERDIYIEENFEESYYDF